MRQFNAYAPPLVYGPYITITKHMGPNQFKITYDAVGATKVLGKVKYFKTATQQVEDEFIDEITIHVGDCIAAIEACFKGTPLGSAVDGTIDPDGLGPELIE